MHALVCINNPEEMAFSCLTTLVYMVYICSLLVCILVGLCMHACGIADIHVHA